MNSSVDLHNKLAFSFSESTSSRIEELCLPLNRYMGIKAFIYIKVFKDASYLSLMNGFLDYRKKYFENVTTQGKFLTIFAAEMTSKDHFYYLWPAQPPKDMILQLLYEHNIWHGFSIWKKTFDYVEISSFAFDGNYDNKTNFFINNVALLEKFSSAFKEKVKDLIECSDREKLGFYKNGIPLVFFKKEAKPFIDSESSLLPQLSKSQNNLELFFNKISKQEYRCMQLLAKGKTAKEIGLYLNLSYRTVESYIAHAKNKLGCNYKSQLADLFWDTHRNE